MAQSGGSSGSSSGGSSSQNWRLFVNIIKWSIWVMTIPIGLMSWVVTIGDFGNLVLDKPNEAKYQGWFAFEIVGDAVVREFKNRKLPWWQRFNFNKFPSDSSNQTTLFYTDFPIHPDDLRYGKSRANDMSVLENRDITYDDEEDADPEISKNNSGTIHAFISQVITEAEENGKSNPLICLYVVGSGRSTASSKFFVITKAKKAKNVEQKVDIHPSAIRTEGDYDSALKKAKERSDKACGNSIEIDKIKSDGKLHEG